jgi:[ribosomal protein S18]-alanine N-acetyltransferase
MGLRLVPLRPEQAAEIAAWSYPPPYDTYNVTEGAEHLLRPELRYQAVLDGDELVGYACYGKDATVPNGDYDGRVLEVGWGMRPDLMGQGRGAPFTGAIVAFAEQHYAPEEMGVTIATFNERSQSAARRQGFTRETGRFTAPDGMDFVQLRRSVKSGV